MSAPLLVLASNSPRRRELLALGGWMFHLSPADVDESQHPGEAPGVYVLRLAESKARACVASTHSALTIIAADTTVALEGDIFGKPENIAEAERMLRHLRGRTHQVHTAIAILRVTDGRLVTDLCTSAVPMRTYADQEIEAYLATGDSLDKAGAYAIQHTEFHPVENFTGCFASVMGLPLCHLMRGLRQLGIVPKTNLPAACQSYLQYACPISAAVLRGENVG